MCIYTYKVRLERCDFVSILPPIVRVFFDMSSLCEEAKSRKNVDLRSSRLVLMASLCNLHVFVAYDFNLT